MLRLKMPLLCLALIVMISSSLKAQSKKELRFKVSTLESQVGQLKNETKEAKKEAKMYKEKLQDIKDNGEIKAELYCDSIVEENENLKTEILMLRNQLFSKKLKMGMDSLHPSLKKAHHIERIPTERKKMMAEFQNHYLSMCFRLKASHRLFSEQLFFEYELNPINNTFEGYVRHQYIPDMGADEYGFQKISGFYGDGEKGTIKLNVTDLDGETVDIVLYHNPKREIYNSLDGEEEDLKKINTKVVAIDLFYFAKCPN